MASKRSVTFFQVGNGSACLVEVGDFFLLLDVNQTEDFQTVDKILKMLPEIDDSRRLDVFCNTHGDKDHCGGFGKMMELVKSDDLVIETIWHPNYDRAKDDDKLPEDYKALRKEILRRKDIDDDDKESGDYEAALTAWQDKSEIPLHRKYPLKFDVQVLSPYRKDEDDDEWDVNDLSLVLVIEISGLRILFPGDCGSEYWIERIRKYVEENPDYSDWTNSDVLVASHHGSYTFFGNIRDKVREADPHPDNYPALDAISPEHLIVSASNRFPTSRDKSGDSPPHYAAYKWYKKWFVDNRGVSKDTDHPKRFKYTADGHIRLEYDSKKNEWTWVKDWAPDDDGGDDGGGKGGKAKKAASTGFIYKGGDTDRGGGEYA
jgi:beta-lactamase superfamily II metal-dependent hydrolase